MTARELRHHREALRANAIAAEYHATTKRDDRRDVYVLQACGRLAVFGGAWNGAAS